MLSSLLLIGAIIVVFFLFVCLQNTQLSASKMPVANRMQKHILYRLTVSDVTPP